MRGDKIRTITVRLSDEELKMLKKVKNSRGVLITAEMFRLLLSEAHDRI